MHKTPPCQASCPSGEDIRGWLNIVRGVEKPPKGTSMQEYAFRRSTDANPFPSMMGRVCPAPCQTGCNRNEVEDYVGINAVEQYIGDYALEQSFAFQAGPDTGKRVAIVGGGPAGLSAAYQLRRKGHAVTLFDDHAELGGMAKYGVPGYRLPRKHLDGEINRIIAMGVEVRTNTRVGVDVTLKDLEAGFDAVLLAHRLQGRPQPARSGRGCAQLHQRRRVPRGLQPGPAAVGRGPRGGGGRRRYLGRRRRRSRAGWATSRTSRRRSARSSW